MIGSYLSLYNS